MRRLLKGELLTSDNVPCAFAADGGEFSQPRGAYGRVESPGQQHRELGDLSRKASALGKLGSTGRCN
jgi:hypothetical protein